MEAPLSPHEPQATPTLTSQVAEVIASWRPENPTDEEAAVLPVVLPTVRRWVTATAPANVASAASLMRAATGLALWGWRELGTLSVEVLLHVENVEYWSMTYNKKHNRSATWCHNTRANLRRVAKTVNAQNWPLRPTPMGGRPLALPYSADEEQTFVLSANLPKLNRAARLWVVCASLGAGMTGAEAVLSVPEDLMELGGGRLAARVRGRNPRLVPIRDAYTPLAREAVKDAEGTKFVQGDNDNAAPLIAAKIAGRPSSAGEATHLSLRRARNTWLAAHLRANTPWPALRVIAGPVSAYKLNALMAHVAERFDPDDAVKLALGT